MILNRSCTRCAVAGTRLEFPDLERVMNAMKSVVFAVDFFRLTVFDSPVVVRLGCSRDTVGRDGLPSRSTVKSEITTRVHASAGEQFASRWRRNGRVF